ncbi:MAG: D-Ala-D-Ala carboxypeptidase family metallohydrolase [Actinomycetota bacterium]
MSNTANSKVALVAVATAACVALVAPSAAAYPFSRTLQEGDTGTDVKQLQVRVAGWFPRSSQRHFELDGVFDAETTKAVQAFQSFYGLTADGVAGQDTFDLLNSFEDKDRSTIHFDYSEFKQNKNSGCSAQANAYAGTLDGGMVSKRRAKRNVKRLMWRLEALRAKGGGVAIGVNSGFRSVPYNDCIGGARASQHMYGTAVDNRMAETSNRMERDLARGSQFHGIGCYARLTHNHFDLRVDNSDAPSSQFWWWPDQDDKGRDLDESGAPCYGEKDTTDPPQAPGGSAPSLNAVRAALPGPASFLPTLAELRAFEAAGEPHLGHAD